VKTISKILPRDGALKKGDAYAAAPRRQKVTNSRRRGLTTNADHTHSPATRAHTSASPGSSRNWTREQWQAYSAARVAAWKVRGLNSRGKPYRRTPNLPLEQRAAHHRQRWLRNWRRQRDRFAARGLNSRGAAYVRADYTAANRLGLLLQIAGSRPARLVALLKSR